MTPNRKLILIMLFAALLLVGCSLESQNASLRSGQVQDKKIEQSASGEETLFTFDVDQGMLDAGSQVIVRGSGSMQSGWLSMVIYNSDGQVAWNSGDFGGKYTFNSFYKPTRLGKHSLAAVWRDGAKGTFSLAYQALFLSAWVLLPGLGMSLVAIIFILYSLRNGGTWRYLGLGALAWIVTVAVKFAIAAAINPVVSKAIFSQGAFWSPGNLVFYIYLGSLTGWTEVLLTWLLLRKKRMGLTPWRKVLAFGVGLGTVEALLLGLSSLSVMSAALLAPQTIPAQTMGTIMISSNPFYSLGPVAERFAVIIVHIFCNVLIFYSLLSSKVRWMWLSFAYKSLIDTIAAFAQVWGVETVAKLWTIEAVIIVFGLAAGWGTGQIRKQYRKAEEELPMASENILETVSAGTPTP